MSSRRVIIAGCGFLGEAAAGFFCDQGWQPLGICASEESARRLAGKPWEVRVADITGPLDLPPEWRNPDALVHCASSGRGGAEAYRSVYLDGLRNLMECLRPGKTLFVSSTSVYAQADGSSVGETSPAEPARETGRVLLEAEKVALAANGHVARLAGLYGPGRSVLMRKFLSGEAILEGGGTRWINQIHRDDAARAVVHLLASSAQPGVYNVSDGSPATQREVYSWLADYFEKPLPPVGEPDLNRKRGWTSKRVENAKLRATGWSPEFASYRDAIPSLALEDQ